MLYQRLLYPHTHKKDIFKGMQLNKKSFKIKIKQESFIFVKKLLSRNFA